MHRKGMVVTNEWTGQRMRVKVSMSLVGGVRWMSRRNVKESIRGLSRCEDSDKDDEWNVSEKRYHSHDATSKPP